MKIALIEGLGSFLFYKHLSGALESSLRELGHQVEVYPWDIKKMPPVDVIIGHSFGAGYAIKNQLKCQTLITLDARRWDFWNNYKMERHFNCKMHFNYYQDRGLRGYRIEGAFNMKIHRTSHTRLPIDCKRRILTTIKELER